MTNPYDVGADNGDGVAAPSVASHMDGAAIRSGAVGSVTVGHTLVIVVGGLALLWALAFAFRKIRMS